MEEKVAEKNKVPAPKGRVADVSPSLVDLP